jgi:hypothetical protein
VQLINAPEHYFSLFTDLPLIKISTSSKQPKDLIHFFVREEKELRKSILELKNSIVPNGIIWISWPKKASKQPTDITEDVVRAIALQNGLVDVKVCAVDEVWSGLKLVIPVNERGSL